MVDESKNERSLGILEVLVREEDQVKIRYKTTELHCYYASCAVQCKMKVKQRDVDERELLWASSSVKESRIWHYRSS